MSQLDEQEVIYTLHDVNTGFPVAGLSRIHTSLASVNKSDRLRRINGDAPPFRIDAQRMPRGRLRWVMVEDCSDLRSDYVTYCWLRSAHAFVALALSLFQRFSISTNTNPVSPVPLPSTRPLPTCCPGGHHRSGEDVIGVLFYLPSDNCR